MAKRAAPRGWPKGHSRCRDRPGSVGACLARGRFRRLGDIFRRRGRNERLGAQIRLPDGRFGRLGDGKRLPIVRNVHEATLKTPNRSKRPCPEGPKHRPIRGLNNLWNKGRVWRQSDKSPLLADHNPRAKFGTCVVGSVPRGSYLDFFFLSTRLTSPELTSCGNR